MFRVEIFNKSHLESAQKIALENYNHEKAATPGLPDIDVLPDLCYFAENALGVTLFDGDKMLGFLCCHSPWENAFDSTAKGTFTPVHAHGALAEQAEQRERIYKRLYQAAAEKWVRSGITYHAISLYAHDAQGINAFFTYGFGLRCVDAVRQLENFAHAPCQDVTFQETGKCEVVKIREMRKRLVIHLGESPCFMRSSRENSESWLQRAETRNSRVFTANRGEQPVAFIEVTDDGETFASEQNSMKNICGAFCLPNYRGMGIMQGLLNYVIFLFKAEGYKSLGVDFESFNPTANGFWLKHFTAYTNTVVRRIDECALMCE